jgi:hypothetical protein
LEENKNCRRDGKGQEDITILFSPPLGLDEGEDCDTEEQTNKKTMLQIGKLTDATPSDALDTRGRKSKKNN